MLVQPENDSPAHVSMPLLPAFVRNTPPHAKGSILSDPIVPRDFPHNL